MEDRLEILPIAWVGVGLLTAALAGAGSWVFGRAFLGSAFQYADLPVLGRVPLASAVAFDVGVLVLVVGATVLMLVALAHQSLRRPRSAEDAAGGAEGAP